MCGQNYCIAGNFRRVQFSLFSQLTGNPRKLNTQELTLYVGRGVAYTDMAEERAAAVAGDMSNDATCTLSFESAKHSDLPTTTDL